MDLLKVQYLPRRSWYCFNKNFLKGLSISIQTLPDSFYGSYYVTCDWFRRGMMNLNLKSGKSHKKNWIMAYNICQMSRVWLFYILKCRYIFVIHIWERNLLSLCFLFQNYQFSIKIYVKNGWKMQKKIFQIFF